MHVSEKDKRGILDGMRVNCWICEKPITPAKAPRALCGKCATGGGLGPYT